jgi:hypothetical protein
LYTHQSTAQKIVEEYISEKDSLRIGAGKADFLPYNEKGYTLVLPDSTNDIKAILVSFEDKRFELQENPTQQIFPQATVKNVAVLYVSTGIPVDLFFSEKSLSYVDATMKAVFAKYHLP